MIELMSWMCSIVKPTWKDEKKIRQIARVIKSSEQAIIVENVLQDWYTFFHTIMVKLNTTTTMQSQARNSSKQLCHDQSKCVILENCLIFYLLLI